MNTTPEKSFHDIKEEIVLTPVDFEVREEVFKKLRGKLLESPLEIREALEAFKPLVDPYQEKVLQAAGKTIRVVAPAGSGKTQTMINRVVYRIKEGIRPDRILMLTFDNAAAKSALDKLNEQYGEINLGVRRPIVKTLNAFGYQILKDHIEEEFFPIAQPYQLRNFVKDSLKSLAGTYPQLFEVLPRYLRYNYYIELFSLFKNELFDPFELDAQDFADFILERDESLPFFDASTDATTAKIILQAIIWLYQSYNYLMKDNNLIDFDDQKLRAYISLLKSDSLCKQIQSQFDEIIVDEFQDINKLDFVFIKLVAETAKLVVTGDDDQAIYWFRGCSPKYIMGLEEYLERPVESYELSVNYRCPINIVHHADRLIRHNEFRIPKNPIAHNKTQANISVVSSVSPGLEAKLVTEHILRIKSLSAKSAQGSGDAAAQKGYSAKDSGSSNIKIETKDSGPELGYSDFAVLYRTNAQSLPIQIEFILKDIPYNVRNEDNILVNQALYMVLAVLRLKIAINSNMEPDPIDAALTIQAYFQFLYNHQVKELERLFSQGRNFFEVVGSYQFSTLTPQHSRNKLENALHEVIESRNLLDTFGILSSEFRGLRSMIGSLEDMHQGQVGLGEIFDVAAEFKGNIREFLRTMTLALDRAKKTKAGKDDNGVSLRTFFRAKGLQWHTVILITSNEGVIPYQNAPLEDERRLFYVGMTRASSNLLISYVNNVCNNIVRPSQFIFQAGLW